MSPVRKVKFPFRKTNSCRQAIAVKNFQKIIPIFAGKIKKQILKVLSSEGLKKPAEITVSFVNDRQIRALNSKYLGRKNPTDVLAFDISKDNSSLVCDIIVCTDTAIRNAAIFNTTPIYELNLYVVHGMLHLLGYNDHNKKQRILMRKKENEYVH